MIPQNSVELSRRLCRFLISSSWRTARLMTGGGLVQHQAHQINFVAAAIVLLGTGHDQSAEKLLFLAEGNDSMTLCGLGVLWDQGRRKNQLAGKPRLLPAVQSLESCRDLTNQGRLAQLNGVLLRDNENPIARISLNQEDHLAAFENRLKLSDQKDPDILEMVKCTNFLDNVAESSGLLMSALQFHRLFFKTSGVSLKTVHHVIERACQGRHLIMATNAHSRSQLTPVDPGRQPEPIP